MQGAQRDAYQASNIAEASSAIEARWVSICHRADLNAIGCSAARLSYLFRLGKCSPLSPPKPTITESAE
jgi:hypothetical protein